MRNNNTALSFRGDFWPLLQLALPMVLTGFLQSAIVFFETMFLSHLGEEILAAGAMVSWFYGTLIVLFMGIMNAINVLVAYRFGAKDNAAISFVFRDGFLLALTLIPIVFLLFWYSAPAFGWFGQDAKMITLAESYLRALAWSIIPHFIMMALLELVIGLGRMIVLTIFSVFTMVLNVFFSYALIFGEWGFPMLGIAGAGWGITVTYWILLVGLVVYLFSQPYYRQYVKNACHLKAPKFIKELLTVGFPIGVMYFFEVAFFLALTFFIAAIDTTWVAPNQIVLQYLCAYMALIFSIAQGLTVRMGHLLGARDKDAAKRASQAGLYISGLLALLSTIAYCFFSPWLIGVDFDVMDPANAVLVEHAMILFIISTLFQSAESIRVILFGALRALQDTRFTLFTSIIGFWVIPFPLGYMAASLFESGAMSTWLAMGLGGVLSCFLLYKRLQKQLVVYVGELTHAD